jgi:hypothetical protein
MRTELCKGWRRTSPFSLGFVLILAVLTFSLPGEALAHAVAEGDKGYIQEISGVHLMSFLYLGAKHMVTGYDHILFLLGVIFSSTG